MAEPVAFVFVPQLGADPPLPAVLKDFASGAEAIDGAKAILLRIAGRNDADCGSIAIAAGDDQANAEWLGCWDWSQSQGWAWTPTD